MSGDLFIVEVLIGYLVVGWMFGDLYVKDADKKHDKRPDNEKYVYGEAHAAATGVIRVILLFFWPFLIFIFYSSFISRV